MALVEFDEQMQHAFLTQFLVKNLYHNSVKMGPHIDHQKFRIRACLSDSDCSIRRYPLSGQIWTGSVRRTRQASTRAAYPRVDTRHQFWFMETSNTFCAFRQQKIPLFDWTSCKLNLKMAEKFHEEPSFLILIHKFQTSIGCGLLVFKINMTRSCLIPREPRRSLLESSSIIKMPA